MFQRCLRGVREEHEYREQDHRSQEQNPCPYRESHILDKDVDPTRTLLGVPSEIESWSRADVLLATRRTASDAAPATSRRAASGCRAQPRRPQHSNKSRLAAGQTPPTEPGQHEVRRRRPLEKSAPPPPPEAAPQGRSPAARPAASGLGDANKKTNENISAVA